MRDRDRGWLLTVPPQPQFHYISVVECNMATYKLAIVCRSERRVSGTGGERDIHSRPLRRQFQCRTRSSKPAPAKPRRTDTPKNGPPGRRMDGVRVSRAGPCPFRNFSSKAFAVAWFTQRGRGSGEAMKTKHDPRNDRKKKHWRARSPSAPEPRNERAKERSREASIKII